MVPLNWCQPIIQHFQSFQKPLSSRKVTVILKVGLEFFYDHLKQSFAFFFPFFCLILWKKRTEQGLLVCAFNEAKIPLEIPSKFCSEINIYKTPLLETHCNKFNC